MRYLLVLLMLTACAAPHGDGISDREARGITDALKQVLSQPQGGQHE